MKERSINALMEIKAIWQANLSWMSLRDAKEACEQAHRRIFAETGHRAVLVEGRMEWDSEAGEDGLFSLAARLVGAPEGVFVPEYRDLRPGERVGEVPPIQLVWMSVPRWERLCSREGASFWVEK